MKIVQQVFCLQDNEKADQRGSVSEGEGERVSNCGLQQLNKAPMEQIERKREVRVSLAHALLAQARVHHNNNINKQNEARGRLDGRQVASKGKCFEAEC